MTLQQIKELDSKNYFGIFNRQNVCFTHGEGAVLFDNTNKPYVDFFSGIAVNCLGYNYKKLVKAISEQAKKLMHVSNVFYSQPQVELCETLLDGTGFDKILLVNSGAEAVESAIKLVRKHFYYKGENKYKIVTAQNSFHGRTLAALTATGQEKFHTGYSPLPGGFCYVPFNDLEALKKLVAKDENIGAVMLECVQGEGGVNVIDYEYLIGVYALCKSKGLLLILDEVQTGMGRTGKLFCFEHFGIQPDIVMLGKGLGGGFPIGALLATQDLANSFKLGDHGSTFGGNALACACAKVVVDELKSSNLLANVEKNGAYLAERLTKLKKYFFVEEIRGMGLLQALKLNEKLNSLEIAGKMLSKGFIIIVAGNNTLRFCPPFVITKAQIDSMTDALGELFAATNI